MIESLKEYWYLWLILLFMCALTVFVWRGALKAGAERNERRRVELERIDRHNRLKKEFSGMTVQTVESAADADLLDGVSEYLMDLLDRAEDDVKLFKTFSPERKYVYTLSFVKDLAFGDSVRRYYRECGEVLGEHTAPAFFAIGQPELADFFKKATAVYDEKNCSTCADEETIAHLEEEFKKLTGVFYIDSAPVKYIRANAEKICDN